MAFFHKKSSFLGEVSVYRESLPDNKSNELYKLGRHSRILTKSIFFDQKLNETIKTIKLP